MSPVVMLGLTIPRSYSKSDSTLRGVMTNYGKPSRLSWTSARGGLVIRGISGNEVSLPPFLSYTVPTVFPMWTTRRCLSSRAFEFALVVTCGLTRFTRVFPPTKHITGEETIKMLLEEWFCVYGAPKEINFDEDARVHSDTGWYKRVPRSLNVQVSTGIPYTYTRNLLCERQIRVLKENVRIWCKTERTKDWGRLLPVISLMMNFQESSATGYAPHELFMGRLAWFLHAPYPEDSYSRVGKLVKEQQGKMDKAKAMLARVRKRQ